MAYFNQERKAKMAPAIKALCKEYGVKGSLAVQHHSTVVLNIKSGKINFVENYNSTLANRNSSGLGQQAVDHLSVNPYWFKEQYSGIALEFLLKAFAILNDGNWDKSDIQSDYFNVGWWVDVNVGKWNQPYVLEA